MKKNATNIRDKTALRAYFGWLNGSTAGADADWLAAEAVEIALAERRATAATKAAETRRAKPKAPAEMLVAAKSRAVIGPTAH